MPRRLNIGRLKVPPHVEEIRKIFEESFPDSVPTDFQIYYTINYFWEVVQESLIKGEEINLPNIGKFYCVERMSRNPREPDSPKYKQYFPRFKWAAIYIYHIREALGTVTEAQRLNFRKRQIFMSELWKRRKEHMIMKQPRKTLEPLDFLNSVHPESVPDVYKAIKDLGLNNYEELKQYYEKLGQPNPYVYTEDFDIQKVVQKRLEEEGLT